MEKHHKELDRLYDYMKYYIDKLCFNTYIFKEIHTNNILDFNNTTKRCNKTGELLCNKYGFNNIKDSKENKLKYFADIYNEFMIVKDNKLIPKKTII